MAMDYTHLYPEYDEKDPADQTFREMLCAKLQMARNTLALKTPLPKFCNGANQNNVEEE